MLNSLNLLCALNTTSYGYVGSYVFDGLLKLNCDVRYFPITQVSPDPIFNFSRESMNTDAIVADGPCLKIWHQHDLAAFIGKGEHIGFTIFELDRFTDRELSHLKSCDRVFVPTKWAQQILSDNNIESEVVNLGYHDSIFTPYVNTSETFVFGNFGKWEIRKGHDILKEAFSLAFSEDDDVELWMMSSNFHLNEQQQRSWYNFYQNSRLGSKIKFAPRVQSQTDVYEIMKNIDCGIFPARAEGWNLEALECLACAKDVIATNYSGHTEFLNDENAYLLDLPEREIAFDGVFFNGQGSWAKFRKSDLDNLVDIMKEVYNKRSKQNTEGPESVSHLTWSHVSEKVLRAMNND